MKKLFKLTLLVTLIVTLFACQTDPNVNGNVVVTPQTNLAQSFPMEAFGGLVKDCFNSNSSNPIELLQTKLNDPDGINNIDINQDGMIDPLLVTEEQTSDPSTKLISVVALPKDNSGVIDSTFICSVHFNVTNPNSSTASYDVSINANQNYYPDHYCYESHFTGTDLLLAYWLFSPRPYYYYHSPYYYSRPVMSYNTYYTRTRVYTTHTTFVKSSNTRYSNSSTYSRKYSTPKNSTYNSSQRSNYSKNTPSKSFSTQQNNKSNFKSNSNNSYKNANNSYNRSTKSTSTPSKSFNRSSSSKSNFRSSSPSRSSSSRSSSSGRSRH